jgi:hypothetical protein
VVGESGFARPAVASHVSPWAVVDFVYVCRASGGELTARREEVAGVRWAPIAGLAGRPTPAELPALVATAARWARLTTPPA